MSMRKIISYIMNSAWQTDDQLFIFTCEARQVASTAVCGECRLVHLLLWSAVC